MIKAITQVLDPLPACGSPPATLLVQLREAHQQLMREMDNMDRITSGPLPDTPELTAARWQISQASLRRRTLSARIVDYLGRRVDAEDAGWLNRLRTENQLAIAGTARHIYQWTIPSIRRDWDGYCKASREIRTLMRVNILQEQQILYPMLERLADRAWPSLEWAALRG